MKVTLVSPRISIQKGDFLGSGVPYWPIELATMAAFLLQRGDSVQVVDLFGSDPFRLEDFGDHYLQGMPYDKLLTTSSLKDSALIVLYAISYMSHHELLAIVNYLHSVTKDVPIVILENSQAVTAYALSETCESFFSFGANALLCGEVYWNWDEIVAFLCSGGAKPSNVIIPGQANKIPARHFNKHPVFPVPAWDLFNLKNYWTLPYSHGPKTKKFLPIITSRGCPYPCDFCVVPETNHKLWRGRLAEEVVNEIITLKERYAVSDFQIEDLNPTVQKKRTEEICRLLIERNARVRFYLVSGTKAETIDIDSLPLMAAAGCRYISISPESGSSSVMKEIGKSFNYDYGIKLVRACRSNAIRTQACFIIGHPAETDIDHGKSISYLRALVKNGLDEVAVFLVAPFAGSALFKKHSISVRHQNLLVSFSPRGRADYGKLKQRRKEMIREFFMRKLLCGFDLWLQGIRAIAGIPQTKMENLPRRVIFIYLLIIKFKIKRFLRSKN